MDPNEDNLEDDDDALHANEENVRLKEYSHFLADHNRTLEQQVAERTDLLGKLNRTYKTLSECNQTLVRVESELELLDAICRVIVKTGGYGFAWVGYTKEINGKAVQTVARAGSESPCHDAIQTFWADDELGQCPTVTAIRTGKVDVVKNIEGAPRHETWRELSLKCGYKSSVALPLINQGETFGALTIYSKHSNGFSKREINLLKDLAADISFGIAALRLKAAHQLAEAEMRKLSSIVEHTPDLIMITDPLGQIEYVNPAFERTTGYSRQEILGQTPRILKSGRQEADFYLKLWRTISAGETFNEFVIDRDKDGTLIYLEQTISPLLDEQGKITQYLSTSKDITKLIYTQEKLQHAASHDPLTDLPNRSMFMEHLSQALPRAQRNDEQLAVLTLNLDRFRLVDEGLGHQHSDEVLQQVAKRIQACLRAEDTVAVLLFDVARVGGDEFAILLENLSNTTVIVPILQRLLQGLSQPFMIHDKEVFLTAGVGVSVYPSDGHDGVALFTKSTSAMRQAKKLGANHYRFYAEDMNTNAQERLILEAELRHALELQQFVLHYQPQVDLNTGAIVSVEALLRWQSPDRGLVEPDRFIPLLEDTGLIIPVGEWILRSACAQQCAWQEQGFPLRVAVNVSTVQFREEDFFDQVQCIIGAVGIAPECLELEITESVVMQDIEQTSLKLHRFSAMHMRLAVDDFGTGYSSLSYLISLPITMLKIDKSFVNNIPEKKQDSDLSHAIIALANSMGMETIAEGIETAAQAKFLRDHGCQLGQGYLFSRPIPAEQIAEFCSKDCTVAFL